MHHKALGRSPLINGARKRGIHCLPAEHVRRSLAVLCGSTPPELCSGLSFLPQSPSTVAGTITFSHGDQHVSFTELAQITRDQKNNYVESYFLASCSLTLLRRSNVRLFFLFAFAQCILSKAKWVLKKNLKSMLSIF